MKASEKKKILERISPNKKEDESMKKCVGDFLKVLESSSKKLGFKCDLYVGGSFGKGTYLKGNFDVDIFCRFSLDYEDESLSSNLEKILDNSKIKFVRQKGSRDYFSGEYGCKDINFHFELIPCLKIEKLTDAKNTTDFSPFHVEFLKKKTKENKELTVQIRLAKQFFKAKGLYGAESYINGFSGHVIDILISYYGSLDALIKDAKGWTERKYIDICNYYKNADDALDNLSKDKHSSLILIDPILKERNAAKALSKDKYDKFVFIASIIDELSEKDFTIEKKDISALLKEQKSFAKKNGFGFLSYEIDLDAQGKSEDIVGSKLLKIHKKISGYFTGFDFSIFEEKYEIDFSKNKCVFIFILKSSTLPKVKKICGPSVYMKEACKSFIEKRDNYFIENSKVCSFEKRKITDINQIKKLDEKDFEEFLNKKVDFIRKIKIIE